MADKAELKGSSLIPFAVLQKPDVRCWLYLISVSAMRYKTFNNGGSMLDLPGVLSYP